LDRRKTYTYVLLIMDQSKPTGGIVQELDALYVLIRGGLYANALNEAKKTFQEKKYPETLKLVRETGELHRRMHLHTIKSDPAKAGGKKEAQKLIEKQAKINDSLQRFAKLVERLEKMATLSPVQSSTPVQARPLPVAQALPDDAVELVIEEKKSHSSSIIDIGTFTQLQTAAHQTGLLPNADAIGFVRDHEFREKKYQEAFDRIEGLFMHLRSAAEKRTQKLKQDEQSYKSGTLKMSIKEWTTKLQRETAQTQKIDRTLRYFARVLDGLRVMITAAYEAK
jgi:hypothetical protein